MGRAELVLLQQGSKTDWQRVCRELREKIHVIEVELYQKQTQTTDLVTKTTTVIYQDDPRCVELRNELSRLQQENSKLRQIHSWHDSRDVFGARNYIHEEVVTNHGEVKREIRKSNSNRQNQNARIVRDALGNIVEYGN